MPFQRLHNFFKKNKKKLLHHIQLICHQFTINHCISYNKFPQMITLCLIIMKVLVNSSSTFIIIFFFHVKSSFSGFNIKLNEVRFIAENLLTPLVQMQPN